MPAGRRLQDVDLDRIARSVEGWRTSLTPLGPGRARGSVVETVLPRSRLVRLVVDTPVALEALPLSTLPDSLLHVGTVTSTAGFLWQGGAVQPGVMLHEEGPVASSFALPGGSELLVARLDRRRVDRVASRLRGAEDPTERGSAPEPLPRWTIEEQRALLRTLLRAEEDSDPETLATAEADLYERAAWILVADGPPAPRAPAARRRIRRRAEEYMQAHAGQRISLSDLCSASECSERTLRYVFRDFYGTSPMAFLRRRRLHGLRQELRDASPRSATVLGLALRWGFWHLGHLGREYKALFGETPGETLAGARGRAAAGPAPGR